MLLNTNKSWAQIWALYEGAAALPSAEWDGDLQQNTSAAAVRLGQLKRLDLDELQVELVHQERGLLGVTRALIFHPSAGQPPERR